MRIIVTTREKSIDITVAVVIENEILTGAMDAGDRRHELVETLESDSRPVAARTVEALRLF